jgi:hypothetical protein
MKNNTVEIIDKIIYGIGKSHGLETPPEGYCEKYKATGAKNCHDCPYDKFCLASVTSKISLSIAISNKDPNFNIIDDVSANMLITSLGMRPLLNDDEFIEDEFYDDEYYD